MANKLRAWIAEGVTSSSGIARQHLMAMVNGELTFLAEIDCLLGDDVGFDEDGEPIHYWDPPKADEPYLAGYALSLLMYHGDCPSGRKAKDAEPYRAFPSLWDAIVGVADWYGWELIVDWIEE